MINILGKLINGVLYSAPRKISIDGKTIFNPGEDVLRGQGYKDVETSEAPAIPTQTQQAVSSWQEQEDKIVQAWELKPAQPDPSAALQELQRQAVLAQIAESEDKTLGIQCMALFPVWERGNYVEGDVRTDPDTGYPFECHTPHDSVSNPGDDWTIKNRALWKPWHSRSAEYALPWEAPTAAYDMYHAGEYMIWTDGTVRRCKADTDRGPDVLPDNWEMVG